MGKQELWQWLAPTPEEAQEVFDRVGCGAAGFTPTRSPTRDHRPALCRAGPLTPTRPPWPTLLLSASARVGLFFTRPYRAARAVHSPRTPLLYGHNYYTLGL